jgi:hypothetical protein
LRLSTKIGGDINDHRTCGILTLLDFNPILSISSSVCAATITSKLKSAPLCLKLVESNFKLLKILQPTWALILDIPCIPTLTNKKF